MAHRSVQLYLYANLPGIGWRYCRAAWTANDKPKPPGLTTRASRHCTFRNVSPPRRAPSPCLPGRGPYFQNGSADKLEQVVKFYDQRFQMGLTANEMEDLVNSLKSL
jgi:cytochrome c peroxidase